MSDSTHAQHDSSHHHVEKISTYLNVFAILMVLLVVTYVAAKIDLDHMVGGLNLIVAMSIAVVKAFLVVLIFMHVKHGTRLVWAFVGAGFVWLVILFVMFSLDYTTRGYEPGVSTAVSAEATVRSAVIERNMSDDAINVSPPHN